MGTDDRVELVSRRRSQAPPPWVIWEALNDPSTSTRGWFWFTVRPGEVMPTILASENPNVVEWASIWEDQPDLRISFEIAPNGPGSSVTWRLWGRSDQLDADDHERRPYRLNQLINGHLRDYFDL